MHVRPTNLLLHSTRDTTPGSSGADGRRRSRRPMEALSKGRAAERTSALQAETPRVVYALPRRSARVRRNRRNLQAGSWEPVPPKDPLDVGFAASTCDLNEMQSALSAKRWFKAKSWRRAAGLKDLRRVSGQTMLQNRPNDASSHNLLGSPRKKRSLAWGAGTACFMV